MSFVPATCRLAGTPGSTVASPPSCLPSSRYASCARRAAATNAVGSVAASRIARSSATSCAARAAGSAGTRGCAGGGRVVPVLGVVDVVAGRDRGGGGGGPADGRPLGGPLPPH